MDELTSENELQHTREQTPAFTPVKELHIAQKLMPEQMLPTEHTEQREPKLVHDNGLMHVNGNTSIIPNILTPYYIFILNTYLKNHFY